MSARLRWRSQHAGRRGSRAPNFPPELPEYPNFPHWFCGQVQCEMDEGIVVDDVLQAASKFPSTRVKKYRSMFSQGYHFRVQSAESHLKTCDSGLAGTFLRSCRAGVGDRNPVVAPIEYVGKLDEIIEVDYGAFKQVVLVASWVQANYRGANATVKKDRWGFTVANFNRMIDFGRDSFALPGHVQQVYFSDCIESPGWKVVIRTEPRGKRVVSGENDVHEGLIFRQGRDQDYEGLRVPADILEDPIPSLPGGRVVHVQHNMDQIEPETDGVFDRDIGESSDED